MTFELVAAMRRALIDRRTDLSVRSADAEGDTAAWCQEEQRALDALVAMLDQGKVTVIR